MKTFYTTHPAAKLPSLGNNGVNHYLSSQTPSCILFCWFSAILHNIFSLQIDECDWVSRKIRTYHVPRRGNVSEETIKKLNLLSEEKQNFSTLIDRNICGLWWNGNSDERKLDRWKICGRRCDPHNGVESGRTCTIVESPFRVNLNQFKMEHVTEKADRIVRWLRSL